MKKILTSIFLVASITVCFAQWQQNPQNGGGPNHHPDYPRKGGDYNQNSSLIINTVSQRPLSVSVDGQQYQSNVNNNTLKVGQLNSGNRKIIVYEEKKNFWGKRVQNIVYNSFINLRPGYETTISINSFGQASIGERPMGNSNTNRQNGYERNNKGNNGKGHAYGKHKNKHHKDHDDDDNDDDRYDKKGRNKGRGNDRD